jgi:EpsD family peptidyl-prolyl cis-trans isomerase
VLERLIDQELTLQQAQAQKLDRDPNVVAAIEAAKRDILSRAYMDRQLERIPAPTPQDVQAYFDSKPELFAQRQIYTLTEVQLSLPPEAVAELRSMLQSGKTADSLAQWAGSQQYRVQVNHLVRPAEGCR